MNEEIPSDSHDTEELHEELMSALFDAVDTAMSRTYNSSATVEDGNKIVVENFPTFYRDGLGFNRHETDVEDHVFVGLAVQHMWEHQETQHDQLGQPYSAMSTPEVAQVTWSRAEGNTYVGNRLTAIRSEANDGHIHYRLLAHHGECSLAEVPIISGVPWTEVTNTEDLNWLLEVALSDVRELELSSTSK